VGYGGKFTGFLGIVTDLEGGVMEGFGKFYR